MTRHFVLLLIIGFFHSIAFGQLKQGDYPNIVFCLADDWGWPHAGAYGDSAVKTPNFDRLANEGILFNHAFVSSPSCTPSRNTFLTGKYHWQLGTGANLWSTLPEEHQSFIHILEDNGYVIGRTKAKTWGPGKLDSWIAHHGSHPSGEQYNTFNEFLEYTNAKETPFFFWLGTTDPHRGYKKGTGKNSGIDISKVHLFKHFPDAEIIRNDIADYYFEVQRWDKLVGSVLEQLEKQGLLDNTIIIMTGDNGMPFPRCKSNLYDAGVRMPFAIRWAKEVKAGRVVDDFISFADIAPTLLEAAGIKVPEDMTGRSFIKILESKKSGMIDAKHRSDIVFGKERHSPAQEKPNFGGYPSRGYRNEQFLYIRNYKPDLWPVGHGRVKYNNNPGATYSDCDDSPTKDYIINNKNKDKEHQQAFQLCFGKRPAEELYDLKNDPDQLHNIATNPDYAKIIEKMRIKLQEKLISFNDPRATDADYDEFDNYPYMRSPRTNKKTK